MSISPAEAAAVLRDADCLYSVADVERAFDAMAAAITDRLKDANPILLCVMNGGMVPTGHLIPRLNFPLQVDYVHATRYRDRLHGNELHWLAEPHIALEGRTVLVIDDILDEGVTLQAILEDCTRRGAKEVLSAVLVEKLHDRKHGARHADFIGLPVEDRYVFGYGMDYKGFLRNAPGIFAARD
jgi:hypoxanthine phosphoribosyltransferase